MADLAAVTRVDIQATDSTGNAIRSAVSGINSVGTAAASATGTLRELASVAGVSLSIAGIAEFVRRTVLAAESLKNLSQVTGSAVEDLSRISDAARSTGIDFDYFRSMVERMASNMDTLGPTSTKAQNALKALGVSTRDPAQALIQVAQALEKYADGVGKAAAMRDIFGRGGAEMAQALHAIAASASEAATTTTQDAEAAAQLAEATRTVIIHMTQLKDLILREVVPRLNDFLVLVNTIKEASGGDWFSALKTAVGMGASPFKSFHDDLAQIDDQIGDVTKTISNFEKQRQNPWWLTFMSQDQFDKAITEQKQKLEDLQKARDLVLSGQRAAALKLLPNLENRTPLDYAGLGEAATGKLSEYDKMINEITKDAATAQQALAALFSVDPITEAQKKLAQFAASPDWQKLTDTQKADVSVRLNAISVMQQEAQTFSQLAKQSAGYAEQRRKDAEDYQQSLNDEVATLSQAIAAVELEARTEGMASEEKERAKLLQDALNISMKEGGLSASEYAEAVKRINAAFDELGQKKSAEKLQQDLGKAAEKLNQDITDALMRGFEAGKDFAANFRDSLTNMFKTLVLRPIVQFIVQPFAQALAPMYQGMMGFGGQGTLGAAGNAAFGGFGFNPFGAGGLSGMYGSFATSTIGQGLGLSAPFYGVEAAGEIGMTQFGNAIGAAIPYMGPIMAAAAIAYSLFAGSKEPSQVKGQLQISGGTGGFEDTQYTASRYFGNIGFKDAATMYFSGAAAQTFNKMIAGMLDAIGARMTPEQRTRTATALQAAQFPSFEGTYTTEDFLKKYGSQVLRQVVDIAFNELNPALAGMVDAFKGADDALPAFVDSLLQFSDVLKQLPQNVQQQLIAAADGTQEMLTKLLAFGQLYQSVQAMMNANPIEDAGLITASQTMLGILSAQAKAVEDLAAKYDGTTEASQALQNATAAYYQSLVQALAQITQMRQTASQNFQDTARSLNLSVMTPEQQYAFYRQENVRFGQELTTTNDAQRAQWLTDRLNQNLSAMWNLLSPEQRQQHLGEFTGPGGYTDQLIQASDAAFERAAQHITDQWSTVITDVRNALNDAASKFQKAADDMGAAANTPTQVDVNVDVNTTTGQTAVEVDTPG